MIEMWSVTSESSFCASSCSSLSFSHSEKKNPRPIHHPTQNRSPTRQMWCCSPTGTPSPSATMATVGLNDVPPPLAQPRQRLTPLPHASLFVRRPSYHNKQTRSAGNSNNNMASAGQPTSTTSTAGSRFPPNSSASSLSSSGTATTNVGVARPFACDPGHGGAGVTLTGGLLQHHQGSLEDQGIDLAQVSTKLLYNAIAKKKEEEEEEEKTNKQKNKNKEEKKPKKWTKMKIDFIFLKFFFF